MPLPLFVGGLLAVAGVAGTALVGSAAREVNENLANDLNSINRDMEEMQKETEKLVTTTKETFEKRNREYSLICNSIKNDTLKDFYFIIKEIKKNCKYFNDNGLLSKYNFLNINLKSYDDNSVYISSLTSVNNNNQIVNGALNLAEGVFLGVSAIKGVSLLYKIDDAIAEKKKLKAECKKVEIKCAEINGSSTFIKTATSTMQTLKIMTDELNSNTKELLEKRAYSLDSLSEQEFKQVMTMFNFNKALDEIINTQLLDDEGNIRKEFKDRFLDGKNKCLVNGGE